MTYYIIFNINYISLLEKIQNIAAHIEDARGTQFENH